LFHNSQSVNEIQNILLAAGKKIVALPDIAVHISASRRFSQISLPFTAVKPGVSFEFQTETNPFQKWHAAQLPNRAASE
jgi:hypothetical protein